MKALHEHKAKKRFGQNFLHDQGVIERIVRAINPKPNQNLVEIGPGLGALTTHVLPKAESLNVVELDRDVIPKLEYACTGLGSLNIFQHDAMKFDFGELYSEQAGKIRVFGNLPYNVSTPLMFHLFSVIDRIQDMHFMLQKEVVERLAAQPNTKAYGRLTVMAQYYCQVEFLFVVKPGAFNPAPKVDSAIVRLKPRTTNELAQCDPQLLKHISTAAFSKRRKTLRNALKDMVSTELMEAANIDPGRRPETLSVAEFVHLTNLVAEQSQ
jgi:16S rRNA (adenine1518-N6/adenine1519-N6)-dimethyltransferase